MILKKNEQRQDHQHREHKGQQKHREDRGKQTTHSRWVQPSAWLPELIAHSQNTERTNSFTSYHLKQCWVHF